MQDFNAFHQTHAIRSNRKEFLIRYTDKSEDLKTFTDMFCNKTYSFKHWLCNAGKNSLFIDYTGLVYPCVEYSYDKANAIFNLYNK
jgi:MoaA/NifB/PqqE/SkfB family radical SAM enzyme